jgi:hypothetical protein
VLSTDDCWSINIKAPASLTVETKDGEEGFQVFGHQLGLRNVQSSYLFGTIYGGLFSARNSFDLSMKKKKMYFLLCQQRFFAHFDWHKVLSTKLCDVLYL